MGRRKIEMRTYNRIQQTQRISLDKIKDLCRLCMEVDSVMYDIFTVSENNLDLSLSSKILKCLSIEVKDCLELPNKLCDCCLKSLNAFTEFWELCHQTDKRLHYLIESSLESSQIELSYHPSSPYSDHGDLYKSPANSPHSQLFSDDEGDPGNSISPPRSAECPSDISRNAAGYNNERIPKPSCESPKWSPPGMGLFECDNDSRASPRCKLEEIGISEGDNGVEVEVSMDGSSYIVEVLDQPSTNNLSTTTEKDINHEKRISEVVNVISVPSCKHVSNNPLCKGSADNSSDLKSHVNVEADPERFICNICSKYFLRKSTLTRHERNHSEERPFKCDQCSSSFKQREVLKRHSFLHSNEKPFKCDSCDKSYTQKEALKNHTKTNHTPKKSLEIVQYKCPWCEKSFCHSSGLSRHQKSHAGKKYPCQSCDKVFADQSGLKRHTLRAHLSVKNEANVKKGSNDSETKKS